MSSSKAEGLANIDEDAIIKNAISNLKDEKSMKSPYKKFGELNVSELPNPQLVEIEKVEEIFSIIKSAQEIKCREERGSKKSRHRIYSDRQLL